ncbi:hypothetical protein EV363DRAFT_1137182, partial [Boletus edulis]
MEQLGFLNSAKRKLSEKAQAALSDSTLGKHKSREDRGATSVAKRARVVHGDSSTKSHSQANREASIPTKKTCTAQENITGQGDTVSKSVSRQRVTCDEEDTLQRDVEVINLDADEDADGNPPTREISPKDQLEQLMKEWSSPVYAFFHPQPTIIEAKGRQAHDFKCATHSCKVKVHHYMDTQDA